MIIKNLYLENFKSFKEKTEFNLEVINRENNIVLIEALNGIGKTSFIEAVKGAFFGLTKDEFKKYISRGAEEKEMIISIEFYNTTDCKTYKIYRCYKYDENNKLTKKIEISIDNNIQNNIGEDEWKQFLQNEFPKEIAQFFFFDGEKVQELIDYKNPKEIKLAIEKILGITDIRSLKDQLSQIKSDKIRRYGLDQEDSKTKVLNMKLKDLLEKKENYKKEISMKRKLKDDTDKKIITQKQDIDFIFSQGLSKNKLEEWDRYKTEISSLKNEKNILDSKITSFLENNLDSFLFIDLGNKIKNDIEKNLVEETDLQYDDIKDLIEKLFKPYCLHCGNKFDKENFNKITTKFKALYPQKTNIKVDKTEYINSIKILNSKKIPNMKDIIQDIDNLENKIEVLERQCAEITSENNPEIQKNEIREMTENLMDMEKTRTNLEKDLDKLQEELTINDKESSKIEFEIENLMQNSEIEETERKAIKLIGTITNVIEEYTNELILNKRKELKEKTNEMFEKLSNRDMNITLEISDDFQVQLYDKNNKEIQEGLNSGHKQILMISLIWGLKECSEKTMPVIIDTPLARLDDIHRENMLKKYFPIAASQVIILSTPTEIPNEVKEDVSWNQYLRNSEYIKMIHDERADSSKTEIISILQTL